MRLWPWAVTRIVLAALFAWAVSGGVAGAAPPARKPKPIRDKTLVAWVYLANLTQRGGSALTLENPGGVFDAIVFGELARGKWMVGSNVFSRTQRQQSRYPAEKADPKTPVQIAVVYRGRRITVYRDGKVYADYTAPGSERFGAGSFVLMGLRLGATLALATQADLPVVKGLVLWEPVINGRKYVDEILRRRMIREMMTTGRKATGRDTARTQLDADGFLDTLKELTP